MPQRFAAGLTPLPTAARVTRARGALRWRIISTIISAVILGLIIYFFGRDWSSGWSIAVISLWIVSSVFWLVVSAVGLRRAKKDLAAIPEGVAFYLDGRGVEFVHPVPAQVAWDRVSALKLVGRAGGAGPSVAVEAEGQSVAKVPVSFIDAAPEVIDSAARAYSLGQVYLDTSALDKVL